MLSKIVLFITLIALFFLGGQMLTWFMQINMTLLREVVSSVFIALFLQPLVMRQFR